MKKEKKNQKLLVQVGAITIVMFIATLALTLISDYIITRRAYLASKQEMMGRDLKEIRTDLIGSEVSEEDKNSEPDWFNRYLREHSADITRPVTDEEKEARNGEEYMDLMQRVFVDEESVDFEQVDPVVQMWFARGSLLMFMYTLQIRSSEIYDAVYIIDILDENESFLLMGDKGVESFQGMDFIGDVNSNDLSTSVCKKIPYPASEHSAVKEILAGGKKANEVIYETYHDSESGKEFYLGYLPIIDEGYKMGYAVVKYDWSEFHSELLGHAKRSMLIGMAVLIVLNGLLMFYMYMSAISPVQKMNMGVQGYMIDMDSAPVTEKMNNIKTKNEIGRLAGSFSELAGRIDSYTEEIVALNNEKARISAELDLATSIQANMLPNTFPAFPDRTEFDIYASMNPAKEVGGDFYDYFFVDEDHLALIIADVSGKGVPAALFMMSSMILLKDHVKIGGKPSKILETVNRRVCENNSEDMFVTVWLGILEISTGKLTAANAGHEYPMININGRYELLKDTHGPVIGFFGESVYKDYEVTLKKGDSLFVYTDGVAEATAADDELFGTDRTLEALNSDADTTPKTVLERVRAAVDGFVKEAPQFDDLTMLSVKLLK